MIAAESSEQTRDAAGWRPQFSVWKTFKFDAAHHIEADAGSDPRYGRVHGHSYQVEVWLRGPRTERGWVVDMAVLESALRETREKLDHRYLNHVDGLGAPTMENIALFVWDSLSSLVGLNAVVVKREQDGEGCVYSGLHGEKR